MLTNGLFQKPQRGFLFPRCRQKEVDRIAITVHGPYRDPHMHFQRLGQRATILYIILIFGVSNVITQKLAF